MQQKVTFADLRESVTRPFDNLYKSELNVYTVFASRMQSNTA